MRVSHLALTDYRSYSDLVVEFPPGVVALRGKNGRGKTNLIEALSYVGSLTSHRGSPPASLVRVADQGEQPGGAVIRTRIEAGGRSDLLELEIARGRPNRARLNRGKVAPRDIVGKLRAVVFAPEDLSLLRGQPEVRRGFLDQVSVKLKPHHIGTLQEFQRVLRQRAAHLKMMQRTGIPSDADVSVLGVWDEQLARLSAQVVAHRLAVTRALAPLVSQDYSRITGGDRRAALEYRCAALPDSSKFPELDLSVVDGRFLGDAQEFVPRMENVFFERLGERRHAETARGVNLVGAHRDDLLVTLDDLPVRGYASHGEIWSTALTLRLAEAHLLRQGGDTPLLVLDDVFAELDESRREGLLEIIGEHEQVLITVAVAADLPEGLDPFVLEVTRGQDGLSRVTPLSPAGGASPEGTRKGV